MNTKNCIKIFFVSFRVCSWLNLLSEFEFAPSFRREFRVFAEQRREMALVFKAGLQTDFDDWQIVFSEKLLGAFDALVCQILLRRKAG